MQLFFERKRLQGFWIADWYATASPEQINTVFGELIAKIGAGALRADVEASYPLTDVEVAPRTLNPFRPWRQSPAHRTGSMRSQRHRLERRGCSVAVV